MMVQAFGLTSRLAGVARINTPSKDAFTKGFLEPRWLAEDIATQAQKLIDQGAGAIVIGSAGLSVIASTAGLAAVPGTSAPIFDCLTVGLKTLEMRVDLSQKMGAPASAQIGFTERLSAKDVDRLRALFERAPV